MEKFDLDEHLKKYFRFQQDPEEMSPQQQIIFTKEVLGQMVDAIHDHYEAQKDVVEYNGPELVDDDYSFKKGADVVELHDGLESLNVVINKLKTLIGSTNYLLCYLDKNNVAHYSVGDGMSVKNLTYLNYILNTQVGMAFHRANMPQPPQRPS